MEFSEDLFLRLCPDIRGSDAGRCRAMRSLFILAPIWESSHLAPVGSFAPEPDGVHVFARHLIDPWTTPILLSQR